MKQQIKRIAFGVIILSVIVSVVVAGFRINAEYHHKAIQIAIRYGDALQIAAETQKSLEEVLRDFKDLGVTTLLVRENTILSPKEGELLGDVEQKRVSIVLGQDLSKQFADISPHLTYVVTEDLGTFDRIYTHLTVKGVEVIKYQEEPYYIIGVEDKAVLETIGTGFIEEDLQLAASLGYGISPEVRWWPEATDESISWMVNELKKIPQLNYIYFEDKDIPGYQNADMINFIQEHGLGFVEFYSPNQKGFDELAHDTKDEEGRYNLIRMFTDEKVENISTPNTVARYELALTERGIRAFTFVLPQGGNPEENKERFENDIKTFSQQAREKGYSISADQIQYSYSHMESWMVLLSGLGTIGIILLLMTYLKLPLLGIIIGSIVAIGYGIGVFTFRDLSVQAMALLTSIVFPVYGIVTQVKETKEMSYTRAIGTFLKITGITLLGCIIVASLLSQPNYALGIDGFRGVKVAHMIPILLIMVIFIYQYRKNIRLELKQLLQTKVSYRPILLILFVLLIGVVFTIYIMRTGNGEISEIEKILRQGLDQLLGVRPRTKEFVIGHPLFILLLYFGYKGIYLPALMLAAIGQISLINTYAHIHTPLMVSLIRSAYGIGIGIVIGIILIQVVKFIFKVINKWIIKQK